MKHCLTALALCLALTASCSSVKRDAGGSYSRSSLGRDTGIELIVEDQPGGGGSMYLAIDQNESRSFLSVAETIRAYFYMDALKSVAEVGFDHLDNKNNTDALVETNKVNAGATTEQARIAAEAAVLTP